MKNHMKKKVLKHLKEDTHEFKEQIADDKKLKSSLMKKSASCKAMPKKKK